MKLQAPDGDSYQTIATGMVTYSTSMSPKITGTSKAYINWRGGEQLEIYGDNFGKNPEAVTVQIDGVPCVVTAADDTYVQCVTGQRQELIEPTLKLWVAGRGLAKNKGHSVKYVCKYSDLDCWSGDMPPGPGDTLHIPKHYHLLIDVDNVPANAQSKEGETPYLTAVVV